MKQSTVKKYTDILLAVKKSGKKLKSFCKEGGISYNNITGAISSLKKQHDNETDEVKHLLNLYNEVVGHKEILVETDDRAEISYIRDENGHIKYYSYQIFRKNKAPLVGKLTRSEMSTIHRLYSYYGDSLTQRVISRHFVDLSLVDFKRILRAYNITKASAPFAPHDIEEKSEEELREIQLREKENSFLRKAEEDLIKNNEKLLKKYAQENIDLKKQLQNISQFSITVPDNLHPIKIEGNRAGEDKSIILYISDLHIGAKVGNDAIYKENINYGPDECKRRLTEILKKVTEINPFNKITLVLMGDNIDCAGFFGKTARMDHSDLPENMDPRDQANAFIDTMLWFIGSIVESHITEEIEVYSVPCGNHAGNFEYLCNKALMATIAAQFVGIKTTLWEEYYGVLEEKGNTFICMHGKDLGFMKRGMPLNLDDKSKVMLYEWLEEHNIHGPNIHFVKGDLHSNALNSCKRLDYRNVLSLFGASDYSNMNFSRNSYGMSYDLFIGNNLIRGTFENI